VLDMGESAGGAGRLGRRADAGMLRHVRAGPGGAAIGAA
jgi:hypothetical protein